MFIYKNKLEHTLKESNFTAVYFKNLPVYLFTFLGHQLKPETTMLETAKLYAAVCVLSWVDQDNQSWGDIKACATPEEADALLKVRLDLLDALPARDLFELLDQLTESTRLSEDKKKATEPGSEA